PGEFAEPAFRLGPAGRQDFRLQHDLGIGDARHVDGRARGEAQRLAAHAAGNRQLVYPDGRLVGGGDQLVWMGADGYRDRQRLAGLVRTLGEGAHVVGRDDVDAGEVLLLHQEPVDAGVEAVFRVLGDG